MGARDLFAVFYAIFFSAVLASCWGFSFFQWGWFLRSAHKTRRLFVSLFLLNFLPAGYFAWFYSKLPVAQINDFWKVLSVFLFGLSIFGFYRLYHLLISFEMIRNRIYEDQERDSKNEDYKALADRLNKVGPWTGQLASVIFYFGIAWLSWRAFFIENNSFDIPKVNVRLMHVKTLLIFLRDITLYLAVFIAQNPLFVFVAIGGWFLFICVFDWLIHRWTKSNDSNNRKLIKEPRVVVGAIIAALGAFIIFTPNIKYWDAWYDKNIEPFRILSEGLTHLNSFELELPTISYDSSISYQNLHRDVSKELRPIDYYQNEKTLDKDADVQKKQFYAIIRILRMIKPEAIRDIDVHKITNRRQWVYEENSGQFLEIMNPIHVYDPNLSSPYVLITTESALREAAMAYKNRIIEGVGTLFVILGVFWPFLWQGSVHIKNVGKDWLFNFIRSKKTK